VGKVIKLNEFRKRKAKAEREKQADTNRRLHGRTKAERARDELQKKRLTQAVDGARLTAPAKPADGGERADDEGEETEAD
jgi:hypothetical protein